MVWSSPEALQEAPGTSVVVLSSEESLRPASSSKSMVNINCGEYKNRHITW